MVQVKWRKAALKDLNTLLEKAYLEYGQHTMNNHISILEDIQKRMQMYPDSYLLLFSQIQMCLCRSSLGYAQKPRFVVEGVEIRQ